MDEEDIRVFLVDDDEDDYVLTRDTLAEAEGARFELDWVDTYEAALEAMEQAQHDVYLVDYFLGERDGLELLCAAIASGCKAPIIMLTGRGDHAVDVAAMKAGAADYLDKSQLSAQLLERSIRYAIERQRAEERLEHLNLVLRAIRSVNQLIVREKDRDRLLQGVCDNLVETRGYHNAWSALFDEAGELVATAEAGLGEEFTPIVEQLKCGELTACGWRALTQSEVVVTEDPPSACVDCPLAANYGGRGALTICLEHGGKVYGLLSASIPAHLTTGREEQVLFEEVAGDIAFALHDIELEKERQRAEEQLRRLAVVVQDSNDAVTVQDLDGHILAWNQGAERMYSWSEVEALAMNIVDTIPESKREEAVAFIRKIQAGEIVESLETQRLTKDGRTLDVWLTVTKLVDDTGRINAIATTERDITERKQAEEALRESERKLKTLFEILPVGVSILDAERNIVYVNPALDGILDISKEGLFKGDYKSRTYLRPDGTLMPAEEYASVRAVKEQKAVHNVEIGVVKEDGNIIWTDVSAVPVAFPDWKVVIVTSDITERKRVEEEIRHHLERIEALRKVDQAITSILDLNQVLGIILRELERVIPYHSAAIFLLSDGTAKVTAARGHPDLARALEVSFLVKDDVLIRQLLQEKRPLVLADAQADERFLARGNTEYVRSWIGVPLIAKERAVGFLTIDHREPGVYDGESAEIVQAFASQVAIAIENARLYEKAQRELAERKRAEEELRRSLEKLQRSLEGTVTTLISVIEMKDPYTAGHQRRTTQLACAIASEMGLPEEHIEALRMAGLIHDIGKITIPAEILSNPSRLNDLQWGMIKAHPQIGYEILKAVEFPWPVAQIVLQHHERVDGSGYPQGLSDGNILMKARILAVADVVEAMSSHRPYRPARGIDEALGEISQNRGVLYDPEVVDACLKLFIEKGFAFE